MNSRFSDLKIWEKPGTKRGYLRGYQIKDALGMKVEYHGSGRMKRADMGDIVFSNAEAQRLLGAKAYYDFNKEEWVLDYLEKYRDKIISYFTEEIRDVSLDKNVLADLVIEKTLRLANTLNANANDPESELVYNCLLALIKKAGGRIEEENGVLKIK